MWVKHKNVSYDTILNMKRFGITSKYFLVKIRIKGQYLIVFITLNAVRGLENQA